MSCPSLLEGEMDHEPKRESFPKAFRHKFINFKELNHPLQVLVGFGVVNLVAIAVFKIIITYVHATVPVLVLDGERFPIPFIAYAVVVLPIALSFITTAALHSHFMVRAGVLAVDAVIGFAFLPQPTHAPQAATVVTALRVAYGAINLIFVWRGYAIWRAIRQARQDGATFLRHRRRSLLRTTGLVYLLTAGYFYAALWYYSITHAVAIGLAHFHSVLTILGLCLIPIYMLAGADYAELSEMIARSLLWTKQGARGHHTLCALAILCGVIILAIDVFLLHDSDGVAYGVSAGVILIFVAPVMTNMAIWIGRLRDGVSTEIPLGVIFLAMGFAVFTLAFSILTDSPLWGIILTGVCYFLFLLGLAALLLFAPQLTLNAAQYAQRAAQIPLNWRYQVNTFIFCSIVTIIGAFSLGHIQAHGGVEMIIAPTVMGVLLALVLLGRLDHDRQMLVGALFTLSVSLLVLLLIYYFFLYTAQQGEVIAIVGIFFVLAALGWDLVASGEVVVERDSKDFPRPARLLLLVGYVVLATTVLTFLADVPLQDTLLMKVPNLRFFDHPFDHVPWVLLGILILGIPTLLMHLLMDIGQWKRHINTVQQQRDNQARQNTANQRATSLKNRRSISWKNRLSWPRTVRERKRAS